MAMQQSDLALVSIPVTMLLIMVQVGQQDNGNTVQYSAVQYSAVRCIAVHVSCVPVAYHTVQSMTHLVCPVLVRPHQYTAAHQPTDH